MCGNTTIKELEYLVINMSFVLALQSSLSVGSVPEPPEIGLAVN